MMYSKQIGKATIEDIVASLPRPPKVENTKGAKEVDFTL